MENAEGVKTTVRYLYDDSGELYGMDYNGTVYAGFVKNLQGDIVSIVPLDSENDSKVNIEYDAWGKPIIGQTSSAQEKLLLIMMMTVTNVAYRSYFYDFDTGLYYLRSRYYDPETGRFINADDTAYLGYDASPLSMNLFAYCENNPVCNIDPSGYYYAVINSNANINSMVNTAKNLSLRSGMIRISYINQSRYVKGKGFINYKMPTKVYNRYIQQNKGNIMYLIYTRTDGVGTYEKPFFVTATVHQWNSYIVRKYASKIDKAKNKIWGYIGKNAKRLGLKVDRKTFDYFLSDLSDYIGESLTDNELLTKAAMAYSLISCILAVIDYIQTTWWTKKDRYIYSTISPYIKKKSWNTRIMILMCVHNYRFTAGSWRYYNTSFPY